MTNTQTLVEQEPNRFVRQESILPREQMAQLSASVIGVGAIGRQIAIQLAAIGMQRIQLIDFDCVEAHNVTTQGYRESEIGELKVTAVASAISEIDSSIKTTQIFDRFRHQQSIHEVVFCCVDSITARSAIWKHLQNKSRFWCDGRMLGEVIRILTAVCNSSREHYSKTLFSQAEAQQGNCTSRSTIYTANVAAGLMVHQFTKWVRGIPVNRDCVFNLLSNELVEN